MILGLVRLVLLVLAVQAVVYVVIWFYARSVRREALEDEWAGNGGIGDRDSHVREGMEDYSRRLRSWLFRGLFAVPIVALGILVYLLIYN